MTLVARAGSLRGIGSGVAVVVTIGLAGCGKSPIVGLAPSPTSSRSVGQSASKEFVAPQNGRPLTWEPNPSWIFSTSPNGGHEPVAVAIATLACRPVTQDALLGSVEVFPDQVGDGDMASAMPGEATYVYTVGSVQFGFVIDKTSTGWALPDWDWGNSPYPAGQNAEVALKMAEGRYTATQAAGFLVPPGAQGPNCSAVGNREGRNALDPFAGSAPTACAQGRATAVDVPPNVGRALGSPLTNALCALAPQIEATVRGRLNGVIDVNEAVLVVPSANPLTAVLYAQGSVHSGVTADQLATSPANLQFGTVDLITQTLCPGLPGSEGLLEGCRYTWSSQPWTDLGGAVILPGFDAVSSGNYETIPGRFVSLDHTLNGVTLSPSNLETAAGAYVATPAAER